MQQDFAAMQRLWIFGGLKPKWRQEQWRTCRESTQHHTTSYNIIQHHTTSYNIIAQEESFWNASLIVVLEKDGIGPGPFLVGVKSICQVLIEEVLREMKGLGKDVKLQDVFDNSMHLGTETIRSFKKHK